MASIFYVQELLRYCTVYGGVRPPMTLSATLKSAKDLLHKLERDIKLLDVEVTTDKFFNFVITAYSICDWIKNDPSVPIAAKKALSQFRTQQEILICRDVANSNKHFVLNPRNQSQAVTQEVKSEAGFGVGRYGVGGFGVGEEEITITLNDGSVFGAIDFASQVIAAWQDFFKQHQV
jgi:hypothetical protein